MFNLYINVTVQNAGMKIGNLMTEIQREQSFTYMYVMDDSISNLNKLQHAQVYYNILKQILH